MLKVHCVNFKTYGCTYHDALKNLPVRKYNLIYLTFITLMRFTLWLRGQPRKLNNVKMALAQPPNFRKLFICL